MHLHGPYGSHGPGLKLLKVRSLHEEFLITRILVGHSTILSCTLSYPDLTPDVKTQRLFKGLLPYDDQ